MLGWQSSCQWPACMATALLLLLLHGVLVASAAPGTDQEPKQAWCTSSCTDQGEDEGDTFGLLFTRAVRKAQGSSLQLQALEETTEASRSAARGQPADLTSMEAFVQAKAADFVADGKNITDEVREAFAIIKTFIQELNVSIYEAHQEDQAELTGALELVEGCGSDDGVEPLPDANETANQKRITHSACRVQEAEQANDTALKCQRYTDGRKTSFQDPPTCSFGDVTTDDPSALEDFEDCLREFSEWWGIWDLYQSCRIGREAQQDQSQACSQKQADFEAAVCSFADKQSDYCSCYNRTVSYYNNRSVSVRVSETARKANFEAALRITCLSDVLLSNSSNKDFNLSECKRSNISTDHLNINYGSVPDALVDCESTFAKPCDDEWKRLEYVSQPWHNQTNMAACKPCSASKETTHLSLLAVPVAIKSDGSLVAWSDKVSQASLPTGRFSTIFGTNFFFWCAIEEPDQQLNCFGNEAAYNLDEWPRVQVSALARPHQEQAAMCVIKAADSKLHCWGHGYQPGQGWAPDGANAYPTDVPVSLVAMGYGGSCALKAEDSKPICWHSWSGGNDPQAMDTEFTDLAYSYTTMCGIKKADRTIMCWGQDIYCSRDHPTEPVKEIKARTYQFCAIKQSDSKLVCWGCAPGDSALDVPTDVAFKTVDLAGHWGCGVREADSKVQCWGKELSWGNLDGPGENVKIR